MTDEKVHTIYECLKEVGYTTKGLRGFYIHIGDMFFGEYENLTYFNTLHGTRYRFVEEKKQEKIDVVEDIVDDDSDYDYNYFNNWLTPPDSKIP